MSGNLLNLLKLLRVLGFGLLNTNRREDFC